MSDAIQKLCEAKDKADHAIGCLITKIQWNMIEVTQTALRNYDIVCLNDNGKGIGKIEADDGGEAPFWADVCRYLVDEYKCPVTFINTGGDPPKITFTYP